MKKRILFISRINLLAGRTNVYNFAKTCEAVNAQPDTQSVLVTTDQDRDVKIFFDKIGVKKPFEIVALGATDTQAESSEPIAFLWANLRLVAHLISQRKNFEAIYFRDESLSPVAWFARMVLHKPVFFEIHSVLQSRLRQKLNMLGVRIADGIIAISTGLKKYYEKWNTNIIVSLCSAPDVDWFDYHKSQEQFRRELELPRDKYILGYVGVVGANPNNDYYEIDDVVRSLARLPEDIIFVIAGELNGNANWLREIAEENGVGQRILILPWLERSRVPKYLQAFDINIVPKRKKDLIGDSPAKMFPALASKKPIVAGRAESIEEVLTNGKDSLIVESNTPSGWAEAILKIYQDKSVGQRLSEQAWLTKDKYTWEKRGLAIGAFIKSLII